MDWIATSRGATTICYVVQTRDHRDDLKLLMEIDPIEKHHKLIFGERAALQQQLTSPAYIGSISIGDNIYNTLRFLSHK